MSFTKFGLSDPLVRGILATGYTAPTEIQSQVIPAAIEGKDIIGCAQTGTGKTAAFVLPILDRLGHESASKKRIIKALILTPTRELALQVEKSIQGYGRYADVKTLAVFGGVKINNQLSSLKKGVDIVVATPGRLMDHMNRRSIDVKHIEMLVLDEADRMLDMGFINDVRKIVNSLPKNRQTMLFSATISPEIKTLSADMLNSPEMFQIGKPRNPIETITQHIYPVRREQKMDLLIHMLNNSQMYSVMVFSRTKHGADKINRRLKKANISSVAIHSDRTQNQRLQAMDGFRRGKFQVIVATDIAARGINIEGISHVINFDVPAFPEDYIHRIGRTGRAEALGDAITFVSYDEQKAIRKIERFIGQDLNTEEFEGFAYKKSDSLEPLPNEKSKRPHQAKTAPKIGQKTHPARRRRRSIKRR
ncbi:MAG: DEAD/DEAH box helicase [Sedimentisphaerales bacterium]|nr:DEAD/DEAH box helicase [Sedimentisphaerales bacterium]